MWRPTWIEHCPLNIENAPVRIVRRVRAFERHKRLLILAGISQRAPVGARQSHVAWIADRRLLQHGYGLGALVVRPQLPRVGDGCIRIVRILTIAGTERLERASVWSLLSEAVSAAPTEPVVSREPILEQPPADRTRRAATATKARK